MSKIENAIEVIGQGLYDLNLDEKTNEEVGTFLGLARNSYVLVQWPESQQYMEEEWFKEEAILDNSENAEGSSYFIPIKYLL